MQGNRFSWRAARKNSAVLTRSSKLTKAKFGRRKYHTGHHVKGQWVFRGVERRHVITRMGISCCRLSVQYCMQIQGPVLEPEVSCYKSWLFTEVFERTWVRPGMINNWVHWWVWPGQWNWNWRDWCRKLECEVSSSENGQTCIVMLNTRLHWVPVLFTQNKSSLWL
jgi:hypothetical protein